MAGDAPAVSLLRRTREPLRPQPGDVPELEPELLLPLASRKDLLGFISLGPKKSEEPYTPADTNLLRTVAAQTGLALENAVCPEIAQEVAQRELINREIEIAREVQQRLFPQKLRPKSRWITPGAAGRRAESAATTTISSRWPAASSAS